MTGREAGVGPDGEATLKLAMATSSTTGSSARPDLGRLRIPRDGRGRRGYRGVPWFGLLILLGLAAAVWLYREPLLGLVARVRETPVETAKAVRVVPGAAQEGDVAANGYVFANRQASVATVLSGRLVELHAEEGDVVPAGFVLGRIQYDDLEASWKAAEERVRVAEAQADEAARAVDEMRAERPRLQAVLEAQRRDETRLTDNLDRLERDVTRNRPLHEKALIDDATWDRIQVDAKTAREAVEAARAQQQAAAASLAALDARVARLQAAAEVARRSVEAARGDAAVAKVTLEKTKIRAPFEGLVIRKDAELGEVIAPTGAGNSRGSVFTIVDPNSLEVQVELSEKRIRKVAEGERASIFLDADPEKAWPGRVRKIWPRADRSKGTIELRVTFDERPDDLRAEMAARVVFVGEEEAAAPTEEPYVTVPLRAVTQRDGGDGVFVLAGGNARFVPVTLSRTVGDRRVVEKGLAGGETVILDPGAELRDGDRVGTEETK